MEMYQEIRPDQATDWEAMGRVAKLLGSARPRRSVSGSGRVLWMPGRGQQ
jgi:hypothetical protein